MFIAACAAMMTAPALADTTPETAQGKVIGIQESDSTNFSERSLGAVEVTAQKRQQSSVEVPTSVTAVTGTMMEVLNVNQMDQVAAFIPGIQIQQQSPNNSSYQMRGVTDDSGEATSQPRVSVFLDGVSNFRRQSSQVELYDLERVEVSKGPQGTLFGRGAEVGGIDIIRKRPTNKLGGEFSINYGTRNQFGVTGVLNTPIIDNKLLNRVALSYDRHDGYIKNEAGGRLNGKSAFAVRNSTRWFITEKTRIDLVLDYQYDDYPGTSFKSYYYAPENGYESTGSNFDPNKSANLEQSDWLGIVRNNGGGLIDLSHRFNNKAWKLTSLTNLRGYKSRENFDADGTCYNLFEATERAKGWMFNEEVRLNYDDGGRFKGFFGANFYYENVNQDVDLYANLQTLYGSYAEAYGISASYLPTEYMENGANYAENHAFELFADGSLEVVDGFTATLGLRGTYEHLRSGYSSTTDASANILTQTALAYVTTNGTTVWARKDYFSWVGRFALNYMIARKNNVYASISRGRRPGVIAFSSDPDELTDLKPEIVWNYEVGVKGNLLPNLYYDLCFYYYDWYNFQSYSYIQEEGSLTMESEALDAGRAHSMGVEATLRYTPIDNLSIFATYAFTDAKFNDKDEDGNEQEYAGNTFRMTPKHTFSIGFDLRVPTTDDAFAYLTPTYTWKDKVYFDDDNDACDNDYLVPLTQGAFGLLNFKAGYNFKVKSLTYDVSIFGRNALDKKYIVDAGNTGQLIGFPTYVGGTRAVYGVMLKLNF